MATRKPYYVCDFYPRSPCGERHTWQRGSRITYVISIHALLAESDVVHALELAGPVLFLSTLSLRRATILHMAHLTEHLFLSTLSLRRATNRGPYHVKRHKNFYPRSPCGERLFGFWCFARWYKISIHALLAESDRIPGPRRPHPCDFYPRSPCGERQAFLSGWRNLYHISIHALLAESDQNFKRAACRAGISIHALLAESDLSPSFACCSCCISIHALLAESDAPGYRQKPRRLVFLSTLSLRRATRERSARLLVQLHFYPRSPCGERRVV